MTRTHVSAYLVGAVMGIMAEMAAGMLLYHGSGLLRATTVVLATQAGAAGAGLLFAARVPRVQLPRQLRKQLQLTLVSLVMAGLLTWIWERSGGMSMVPGGQAATLAFLAALPLYLAGTSLGLLCRECGPRNPAGVEGTSAVAAVGGASLALLGAATGFLVYGFVLIPRFVPLVLVLLCMAAISGAALLHGSRTWPGAAPEDSPDGESPGTEEPEAVSSAEQDVATPSNTS